MNKELSFVVALLFTVAFVIVFDMAWLSKDGTAFLIYWYMLWKLFHNKNKD